MRRPQGQKTAKKLNVSKLKNSRVAEILVTGLEDRLPDTPEADGTSIEEQWTAFRDAVYTTALEHLGPVTRRNQDWFDENDEEIRALLTEKHQQYREHLNDPTSLAKKDAFANVRRSAAKTARDAGQLV